MAEVNAWGCGCASLGTWSLGTSNFLTGTAGRGAHWWSHSRGLWPLLPSGLLLGDVTPDLFQLITSSMLAAVCLGLNEPWDPWESRHFSDSSLGVPSVCLQEQVDLGRGEVALLLLVEVTFALSEIRSPQGRCEALIYGRTSSLFLDSSYGYNLQFTEMLANCPKPVLRGIPSNVLVWRTSS